MKDFHSISQYEFTIFIQSAYIQTPNYNMIKQMNNDEPNKASKAELIDELESTAKYVNNLPLGAKYEPITHSDYAWLLEHLAQIFKAE
jgi:hypothetical protein